MHVSKKMLKNYAKMLIHPLKADEYQQKVEDASLKITNLKKASEMEEVLEMIFGKKPQMRKALNVAYIPVKGVLGSDLTEIESMMGSVDVQEIEEMLEDAESDEAIDTIVMEYNSPGGSVTGIPELARKIKNCTKRTIGFTKSQSCSGSMWLMSQCDEVYCTESSVVGSIGVYVMVLKTKKAYEAEGVEVDLIKSGWAKAAGYPGTEMTGDQHKLFEEDVAEVHRWFIDAVKSVRTYADEADMQGQTWNGKKAAEKMLVSGIMDSLDDVFAYIGEDVAKAFELMENGHEIGAKYGHGAEAKADVSPEQGKDLKKKKKKKKEKDEMDEAEESDEGDEGDEGDEAEDSDDPNHGEIEEEDIGNSAPIETDPENKKKRGL